MLSELVDWFHRVMRKDEKWGYIRYDMKWDPFFRMKVSLTEAICPGWPLGYLGWEKLEKVRT
jgi:NADH dehydrogenase (ubiquinone) 1 alpha subcomplex subunit 9